jgi:predicted ester cyclase
MMTTEQSRQLISEYVKIVGNDKSEANMDKYIADPVLKGHIVVFTAGMPDYQIIPKDMIAEGNKVTLRFVMEGEHSGEFMGIAPTGRKVSVDGIIIYELENNKIINHWIQMDTVSLMQQIGASVAAVSTH